MRYGVGTKVVNALGEHIPLRDQSVDVVFCYEVIEHVFDPVALLKEIRRVIRPSGSVFISVPNRWAPYDDHYHLWVINYLPRAIGDWIIRKVFNRYKGEDISAGVQKLSEMHYFRFFSFLALCKRVGFIVHDVREEKLMSGQNLPASPIMQWLIRMLRKYRVLRPAFSIFRCTIMQGWHFKLNAK